MLKTYLQINNLSVYYLSKKSGVPYSTVNDLANNKTLAGNCRASIIQKLAAAMQISMEEFLSICEQPEFISTEHGAVKAYIYSRDKTYYVSFLYGEKRHELAVSPVCRDIATFLSELSEWTVDNYLADMQLEVMADELLYNA